MAQIPEGWRKVYRAKIDDEGNIKAIRSSYFIDMQMAGMMKLDMIILSVN